jgi:hypothetical protein
VDTVATATKAAAKEAQHTSLKLLDPERTPLLSLSRSDDASGAFPALLRWAGAKQAVMRPFLERSWEQLSNWLGELAVRLRGPNSTMARLISALVIGVMVGCVVLMCNCRSRSAYRLVAGAASDVDADGLVEIDLAAERLEKGSATALAKTPCGLHARLHNSSAWSASGVKRGIRLNLDATDLDSIPII